MKKIFVAAVMLVGAASFARASSTVPTASVALSTVPCSVPAQMMIVNNTNTVISVKFYTPRNGLAAFTDRIDTGFSDYWQTKALVRPNGYAPTVEGVVGGTPDGRIRGLPFHCTTLMPSVNGCPKPGQSDLRVEVEQRTMPSMAVCKMTTY